jgi:glutamyl-Q tRNA(Asp) synthetase
MGSYLEAKSRGGEWQLRIDDLDPPRVAPGAVESILRCLEALGFEWDGAIVYQSRRVPAYHGALHQLRALGAVYPCACSRKEIAESALAGTESRGYPGSCREGLPSGRRARALRLKVEGIRVEFEDGLLGPQLRDFGREFGDFILYRADGVYAFHLASAVDDAEYGMTDIVRGADLLESSARQLGLMRLLGHRAPRYVHLPVAVDRSGEKLSKQTKALPVDPARPLSVLQAVLRFLNQSSEAESERITLDEFWRHAILRWDLRRVGVRLTGPAPN